MKITASILVSASLFCLISCSETSKETTNTTSETAPASTELSASDITAPTTPADAAAPAEGTQMPTAPTTPASGITMETPAGMNPPHGQPGHDCAVAVGAPLNSKGKSTNAMPQISTSQEQVNAMPATPVPQPSAAPVTTAPGMNPPHGQPGHDCAVAVGAPLKK